MRPALTLFTPAPPARTGIADYAAQLRAALAAHYEVAEGRADAAPAARVLRQLGNSPALAFVLHALRRWPGVVTLHDPSLLWLREQIGEPPEAPGEGRYGEWARHRLAQLARGEGAGRSDHLLLDQAGDVLRHARAVVVHSRFAAARLRALHGAGNIHVVPHLLPPVRAITRAEARRELGLPPDAFLLATAGFAHPGKRLDWVMEALERAPHAHWLHAGAEDPSWPLRALLAQRPALAGRARVTGWLAESALDAHIAAADLLACLHFPSHGETSGILARGLALGVACVVADTAAYRELPAEAVPRVPVPDAVPALAALLHRERAALHAQGEAGHAWAARAWAPERVAALYREVIEASLDRAPLAAPLPLRAGPRVLMVAPMASHAPQGNSARLAAFGAALKARGARVELLYHGLDGQDAAGEAAMRAAWDAYHYLAPQPHPRMRFATHWGLDDWCPPRLCEAVATLHRAHGYAAVVAHYVWQSGVLEHVPGALRVLDTHDLFGGRAQVAAQDGIAPNWYFTSIAEEARGLARADLVLAIQDQEATALRQRGARRVLTLGHPPALRPRPGGAPLAPFGLMASANPWNLRATQALDAALAGTALPWALAGRVAEHPALVLRSRPLRLGRVARVAAFYAQVGCVLNPMQGGTGLKIKTVEALGFAMPVLGTRAAFAGLGASHPAHQAESAAALVPLMRAWQASAAFRAEVAEAGAALIARYGASVEAQYHALMDALRGG